MKALDNNAPNKKTLSLSGLGKFVPRSLMGSVLAAAIATSVPALADERNDYRRSSFDLGRIVLNLNNDSRYDSRYNSRRNHRVDRNRHVDSRYRRSGPITVRLNYDANGDGRIGLKRMLKNQHGIDANDWRIRSVNVRHKSRREACADLTVGGRSTGPVYLRKGVTTIAAPRGRDNGAWLLGFENAKLRDVAVVLEPRFDNDRHNRNGDRNRNSNSNRDRELSFNSRVR